MIQARFENGVYRDCKWCRGKGCLSCPAEADKEYKRQFPDGPQPIATFNTDDPEDVERMRNVIGIEALQKAFGPGGGGISEIIENAKKANP